jgi:hypothetical protein
LSRRLTCHNELGPILSCAICEKRKEKRFCPALHGRICPQCCGEQREVTLDCPTECIYLQQARAHEKPRPIPELEKAELFLKVEVGDQFLYENEQIIVGLSYSLARVARSVPGVHDSDLIAALTALARSYETLANSGLVYEAPMTNLTEQAIASEIQKMVKEYRDAEQKHLGYTRLRDADVLRGLVFVLRMAVTRTSGRRRSRAFMDLLFRQFPEEGFPVATTNEASRIIVP